MQIWREKLDFLYMERAKASDPAAKFDLDKQIEEALEVLKSLSEGSGIAGLGEDNEMVAREPGNAEGSFSWIGKGSSSVHIINRPGGGSYNADFYDFWASLVSDPKTQQCLFSGEGFNTDRPGASEQAEKILRSIETALDNGANVIRIHTGGITSRSFARRLAELARSNGGRFRQHLLRTGADSRISDIFLINPDSPAWNVSELMFNTPSLDDSSADPLAGGAIFIFNNLAMALDLKARFDAMLQRSVFLEPGEVEEMLAGEILYFAYGSNMQKDQMLRRCPRAEFVGSGRISGFSISFAQPAKHRPGGVACVLEDISAETWGVIWRLPQMDLHGLDEFEDRSTYDRITVPALMADSSSVICEIYVAKEPQRGLLPQESYLALLLQGALEAALPSDYVRILRRQQTLEESDLANE